MAPLVERIGCMTRARDLFRGFGPGVAGLAAAMQQQHGRTAVAEHVGDEFIAGGADEGRGGGREVPSHGHSLRIRNFPISAGLPPGRPLILAQNVIHPSQCLHGGGEP